MDSLNISLNAVRKDSSRTFQSNRSIEPFVWEERNLHAPMFDLIEGEIGFIGMKCSATEHRTIVHTDCPDYDSSVTV